MERADAENFASVNCHVALSRLLRLENDVAANPIDFEVAPVAAERGDQVVPAQVTGKLHPRANISSRT